MKMGKGIPGRGNSTHRSCGASNAGHIQGAVGTQVWLGPAGHGVGWPQTGLKSSWARSQTPQAWKWATPPGSGNVQQGTGLFGSGLWNVPVAEMVELKGKGRF